MTWVEIDSNLSFEKETHRFQINGRPVPSVTGILKGAGLIDDRWFDQYYADRGRDIHLTCQLYDEGDLNEETLDPVLAGYLAGWKKFLKDTGFKIMDIEKPVYRPDLQYAGILDRFGVMFGEDVIIDLKSGAVPWWVGLQLAGYELTYPPLLMAGIKRLAVQLNQNGTWRQHPFTDRHDRAAFKACLEIEHLKRRMNK